MENNENNEKMYTADELLAEFDGLYDNYMEALVSNLKRGADISKFVFEKAQSQEPLEKYLDYFNEVIKSAVAMREALEEKVKVIGELEQKYFGEK